MTYDQHGLPHMDPPPPPFAPDLQLAYAQEFGRRPPPDTSWLQMVCVCCGYPEHRPWWRRIWPLR